MHIHESILIRAIVHRIHSFSVQGSFCEPQISAVRTGKGDKNIRTNLLKNNVVTVPQEAEYFQLTCIKAHKYTFYFPKEMWVRKT